MTTIKPTFLLDCDGVLSDFTGACLRVLNEDLDVLKIAGGTISKAQWSTYYAEDSLPFLPKVTWEALYAQVVAPGFCSGMPVLPGARDFVRELRELCDVVVLTAPWDSSPHWHSERVRWLETFFDFKPKDVVFAGSERKKLVRGSFLLDDRGSNVSSWQAINFAGLGMTFSAHHNIGEPVPCRRDTYEEVLAEVRGWLKVAT